MERDDIPFHYALAENFTICDNYHCSVLGPTWPNRLYHWSAWIDPQGAAGGPIISNVDPTPYGWQTYPEALTAAGVPWQVYQEIDNYECNPLEMFNSFQSEHPDYTPAAGADFVASKIDAVAANPDVWNSTVFILNYDENDGLFDHGDRDLRDLHRYEQGRPGDPRGSRDQRAAGHRGEPGRIAGLDRQRLHGRRLGHLHRDQLGRRHARAGHRHVQPRRGHYGHRFRTSSVSSGRRAVVRPDDSPPHLFAFRARTPGRHARPGLRRARAGSPSAGLPARRARRRCG
jgi:Phosphoesterase family